ncbi:MAG TPA: CGNR zinc finger domain-containing protein [Actinotalea caeni]|uniref:CGNR zinc finger domain-containing protein n=1 Tax=Actinotalea caeni TaxID=1348467 RepID=UPI0012E0EAA1|nr:CGNR zinc finger domain-containing protein [Actinotalea caeni]HLV54113.1 CGNR zinc finger domain-containing protein [Actinotalea caeni]
MLFAHDTSLALAGTAALVNTAAAPETLRTVGELAEFLDRWEWTGARAGDEAELEEVRALRSRLRELWEVDDERRVAIVNALLRENGALPQLVRHGTWSWHLHAMPDDAPLAARMAVESAMAMADVIRAGETDRLATCAAPDCEGVVVDLSKNRSRKYCSTACTNRVAAAAYRARRHGD